MLAGYTGGTLQVSHPMWFAQWIEVGMYLFVWPTTLVVIGWRLRRKGVREGW